MVKARLAGFGVATPQQLDQDQLWDGYFAKQTGGSQRAQQIFKNAGVDTRHGVINPLIEDVSTMSTQQRMQRYEVESLPLGESALRQALDEAGIAAADLGSLTIVSCTGYATPGLDITLAQRLGAASDLQRVVIGHMGCYAAIPGLRTASDFVKTTGRPAAVLCVELTSLHAQPAPLDTEQTVAHALFSDAAAAVVLTAGDVDGPCVTDIAARTDADYADAMTWHITDTGFRMGLSSRVPLVLARHLPDTVSTLLGRHDLSIADIDTWAVHPGGRKILDVTQQALKLPTDALDASRDMLRHCGNCSSATILMILRQLHEQKRLHRDTLALAFGPGLTLYAALIRHQ